ncbi:MlaA family lipoprotein [Leptotrichia sp. oral taxon 847]|uniref:MlaA family lipoprotein n=1 Tax=Leptotrichia sp. oral taxon 847 TaxID=1785996 RepID=UPI0007683759|nr:VacJ family lipoprotein [Leptotrichia sp. oral taxon 847]AMD94376.1 ABC transporter [Leptotrichia sp. oral taxon 847]
MTKFNKNKIVIFGAVIAACAVSYADTDELYPEVKNVDTVSYLDEATKEANDDIYIEFVDEKENIPAEKNMEKFKLTNLKNKNKKIDKNKYIMFEQDDYGDLATNIEGLDDEYIVSSKILDLTGAGGTINDPLEPFNRRMYAFNTQFDKKIAYPASRIYAAIVPKPIRTGISNFFGNFKEIPTFVNSMLQLKPGKAVNALGRFVVNSTVGILGVTDVATKMGLKKDYETMGDTLGHYGVRSGAYLVLPALGPSNIRDGIGSGIDGAMEGAARGVVEDKLFFDTGVFDKTTYGFTRPVVTGLNLRSLVNFRYGDLNSPFEYDLVKIFYQNYRKVQIKK